MSSTEGEWLSMEAKLVISGFVVGLGVSSSVYFIPVFMQELSANYTLIGIMGSVRSLPYAVLPGLTGLMIARYDARKLYLLTSLFAAAGLLLLSASHGFVEVGLANLLIGLSMVFYWPVAESIIAETFRDDHRRRAFSNFSASWSTAYFVGPMVGGLIAEAAGVRTLFLASAITSLAAAPFINTMGELRLGGEGSRGMMRKTMSVWPIYLGCLLFTVGLACIIMLSPSYLYQRGWSSTMIGAAFTSFGLARTAAYLLMGRLRRIDEVRVMTLAIVAQSIVMLPLSTTHPLTVIPSFIVAGLANGIYYMAAFNLVSRLVEAGYRGAAIGLIEGIIGVGFTVGPGLIGPLIDLFGGGAAFTVTSIVILSSLSFLAAVRRS